jgi:hypothetical protein
MIGDIGFHGGRDAKALMKTAKVVPSKMQAVRGPQVLPLLAEGICPDPAGPVRFFPARAKRPEQAPSRTPTLRHNQPAHEILYPPNPSAPVNRLRGGLRNVGMHDWRSWSSGADPLIQHISNSRLGNADAEGPAACRSRMHPPAELRLLQASPGLATVGPRLAHVRSCGGGLACGPNRQELTPQRRKPDRRRGHDFVRRLEVDRGKTPLPVAPHDSPLRLRD